ncbi:MerR family transcriptional regulator [Sedimentibacter sp.]|uniref:MerR family transcriptional regulator n=1 Tax=Sedimentibacter sp. TaxID=1960295 RepID=UPI0028A20316|nr:MerR family transcriptional regulator [Sedimentibacter sp.]
MKIGKFAKMHNVTQDTIRHYIDLGLLVTEKKGGQYQFSDTDCSDIKKIIEYKNMSFSLSEIQKLLAMQRISGENSNSFRKLFLSYLEEKKKENEKVISQFNNINNSLREKINNIKQQENKDVQKLGFPLSSIHLLKCPDCRRQLNLSEGIIENNNVIEAIINCGCGFTAVIKEGMYVDKRHVRTKLLNGKRMPSKEEYLASSSTQYNNFLYKGMALLVEQINKYQGAPKYILELDNCVGFFLMQFIKYLPSDSTYILIDYDYERLENLKKDLENYYNHKNFIFLCCNYGSLPLKDSFADIIIDYQMTSKHEELTGEKLYNLMLPLLTTKGIICGVYSYKEVQNYNESKNLYDKIKMQELMYNYHLKLLDSTDVGPFTESISDVGDISQQKMFQVIYVCNKNTGQHNV